MPKILRIAHRARMRDTVMELPSLQSLRKRELVLTSCRGDASLINESPFKIRVANDAVRRGEASTLLRERYAWRGYQSQELAADANRLTIVAYHGTSKVGTLSIGMDGSDGLLSDMLYRTEIDALRAAGRKVCEFIKFAVDIRTYSVNTLVALFHTAFIFAYRVRGFDDVVVEVNPRHAPFYQHGLGFRQISEQRTNRRVLAPAVLLHCELAHIAAGLDAVSSQPLPRQNDRTLYPYCLTLQEEEHIRRCFMHLQP